MPLLAEAETQVEGREGCEVDLVFGRVDRFGELGEGKSRVDGGIVRREVGDGEAGQLVLLEVVVDVEWRMIVVVEGKDAGDREDGRDGEDKSGEVAEQG